MRHEMIISGFGGQGALFAGQLLAHAAMDSGLHVTWIPSYGPEMRGGTARCTVVVSDEEIGSPLVRRPGASVVLNLPSMEAFELAVQPGGVLVINSSLVPKRCEREDIQAIHIPATGVAEEMGDIRLANVICLGALAKATGVVTVAALETALERNLPKRHHHLMDLNRQALAHGAAAAAA